MGRWGRWVGGGIGEVGGVGWDLWLLLLNGIRWEAERPVRYGYLDGIGLSVER